MLVQLDAHLADMARLFVAQQVPGAANIQIVARQRETGPERIQRLHDFQPAHRGIRHLPVSGQRQVAIAALFRPPDTAAKLVELRQPQHVGPMNDQRVGGRDIEPDSTIWVDSNRSTTPS